MQRPPILLNLLVAAAYALASEAAVGALTLHGAAIVWFASAVGIAALLLFGARVLPGIALGALACALLGGKAPLLAVADAALTTAQLALTWWLLVRLVRFDPALQRVQDVLLLAGVGATVSPAINAARSLVAEYWREGAITAQTVGFAEFATLGEVVGILLVVPAALTWARARSAEPVLPGKEAILYGVTLATSLAVFGAMLGPLMRVDSLPYALFPIAVWAAYSFGVRQTATVLLIAGITAIACHRMGEGPFAGRAISADVDMENIASLYLFLAVLSATALLFAASRRERGAAEARLRESEEKYRLLVDNQTDLVARICGRTRHVLYASPSHYAFFGKTDGEMLGRPLTEAFEVHEEDGAAMCEALDAVARPPYTAAGEARVMTPQGWRWLAWSARAVLDAQGRCDCIILVGRDVTARRRAEEQSRQHLQQLAHVSRVSSMGEMASAIAHEINQPLTAISNYASACIRMLRSGSVQPAETLDAMQRVASEAQRAGEIVRKMRGFVRGDEGEHAGVDVNALVTDVLRLAGPEARQYGVELCWAPVTGLPKVLADPIQVQQVLLNLVRNASESIHQADSGTRRVTLSTALADGGRMIEIAVHDTGPGIAEGALDKVFEPFYTTKADGIGIGLSLSRSIMDAHGGRLWATAQADGATFHLTLPVVEEQEHAEA
ncbi:MAG: MASE1 domain-containing protein [Burkholderiales bacterium]